MIQKICDFCKRTENKEQRIDYMAHLELTKLSGWEYIIGRKIKFEICNECFEAILKARSELNK